MKRNWNRNIQDLEGRLKKANDLLDREFPNVQECRKEKSNTSGEMAQTNSSVTEKVIRDKNTIVQITVHTKPKEKDKKSEAHYLEPTVESRSRSRSSSHKKSPRRPSRKSAKTREKENVENKVVETASGGKRDVPELLKELKQVIQSSGVKDVYEFLRDMDDGNVRRKSAPGPISKQQTSVNVPNPTEIAGKSKVMPGNSKERTQTKPLRTVKPGNVPQRVTGRLQTIPAKIDEDIENQEIRDRMKADNEKLVLEMNKLKSEVSRYKSEFDNSVAQLKIAQESNDSLQNQIVEMKQLISKLTGNNRSLVQLVSDRTSQDEKYAEIEIKNKQLTQQLEKEKSTVSTLQNTIREQENEIKSLKLLTADIHAQLMHGLEGLDIPRPGSSLPNNLLNLTSDILGNTIMKPDQKRPQRNPQRVGASTGSSRRPDSQSSDSAIDDPNSEKLNFPAKPVFHAPPPPRMPPPPQQVQGDRRGAGSGGGSTTPSIQPLSSNQSSANKYGGPFRFPQSSVYSNSPPTRQVSSRLRQQTSQLVDEMELPGTAVSSTMISRQTSRNLFTTNSRVASSSLMNSILAEDLSTKEKNDQQRPDGPQEPDGQQRSDDQQRSDGQQQARKSGEDVPGDKEAGGQNKFTAASLDLEETVEQDDLDGVSGQTKSTPATVIHQSSVTKTVPSSSTKPSDDDTLAGVHNKFKQNLETKVQDFLDRLRQDSFNYSMPQAQSFQGASFHLSLSGDEAIQDVSQETTLTEGGFRRGLESSIDILSQD